MSKPIKIVQSVPSEPPPQPDEVVSFKKFNPLFAEIGHLLNDVIDIVQAAEHNKRTCEALKQRIYVANLAVLDLKVRRENQEFFNRKNFIRLQSLATVITQIKKFVLEISQMKTLLKFKLIQPKTIEKTFNELCKDFDNCILGIDLAIFTTTKESKIKPEEEIEGLKADQDELHKFLKTIIQESAGDVKELQSEFYSMVLKINAMNNTMERLLDEQTRHSSENDKFYQNKIDKIFKVHELKFSGYTKTAKEARKERVTKWVKAENTAEEFAFKFISTEDKNSVQNQVTILKELHDFVNIIKFYGITCDGNRWYLVTEWAEYGNLREYYTNYKSRFDRRLKLRMSLDIARGLNFLRTVEIVHRDIRAENILVTIHETAKLANFKLSRYLTAATLKQTQNLERVRYCAPELLERAPDFKYDHKCEVYSFGILLWEIAEEKTPYEEHTDIMKITELVRNKNREPFSEDNQMPEGFKKLAIDAVNHDPEFRPKLTQMFEVLRNCFEEIEKPSQKTSSSIPKSSQTPTRPSPKHTPSSDQNECAFPTDLPDCESFRYMTLADAAKQHKMIDRTGKIIGDKETAYKCFEAYANLNQANANRNQIKAKYFKAYYLLKGWAKPEISSEEQDKLIAQLFKEVADDEINEFPEAKLRYGDCLYNGKGVRQNLPEALKYFELAAKNDFKVAMYNAGKLYFTGCGGQIRPDKAKATEYMKLAIYHEYDPALKFCKDNNIDVST